MDDRFHSAQRAIQADNPVELEQLLRADPSLARDRSHAKGDHPTLLCCLVITMPPRRSLDSLIRLCVEFGAETNDSLIAAACVDNVLGVESLLDLGGGINGNGNWSPLEEALYWGHRATVDLLLRRGASVDNLRKYAALGDLAGVRRCFDENGQLTEEAGKVAWPFGDTIPASVRHDRRQIVNNALVFAAAWGQHETAAELLAHGAEINAIPAGFDFAGTPLHYAALNNRREMADWLLARGADPNIRDTKVHNTPDGWAAYANHHELATHLRTMLR
ncbi:MAG: ankyrin repeat domain-containing protein [Planctomycetota bacterium]|nr:ankyrin repeat domain-containing protein [Planctomycetota bacterium]